ncbi:MAG: prepilin-type N-terminal cleavage/methylation domain-containing protein [Simplicispira suum]|uniref:PulJ/GspJ family protein n=1 Tax=Simplicispira suum TaxID=2109915 RepID=UPI001C6B4A83|nr:prepilin-type N-terminal cleavage/methylation domain-containing protein [Simplicispira suum]MBW7832065.1 prepilin-type N-terminal cleavage/methylation domain-containing protein [Simplicispira suum]
MSRRSPRSARGFTLIELLIAIALLGLMALMSWRGIDGMVRAQQQTKARGDALLTLQAALGQWGADLDALVALPNTTPIDWDGQALRITRRSSAGGDAGALVVAWSQREVAGTTQWLRWQSAPVTTRGDWQRAWDQATVWARSAGDAERKGEVALVPLIGWQIFYFRGNAWSNPLSSRGTPTAQSVGQASAAAKAQALVPDGIRLQLDLGPNDALAGRLTRDWVNPLNGGGKS